MNLFAPLAMIVVISLEVVERRQANRPYHLPFTLLLSVATSQIDFGRSWLDILVQIVFSLVLIGYFIDVIRVILKQDREK